VIIFIFVSGCKESREDVGHDIKIRVAVASASLATIITYCRTIFGDISQGDGLSCFDESRDKIPDGFFDDQVVIIKEECNEESAFNTCITPRIGRVSDLIYRSIVIDSN
jgi:hypothetical protein